MRDHRKLRVFTLADQLVVQIYEITRAFPEGEKFGLTSQLRRAAVSVPANIVEGAARQSDVDFARFLRIAYASACELEYELCLAVRLELVERSKAATTCELASRTCRAIRAMIIQMRTNRRARPLSGQPTS